MSQADEIISNMAVTPMSLIISLFKTDVIFHKRVRVFYQGFQTRKNNRFHEIVYQTIFIVLENL